MQTLQIKLRLFCVVLLVEEGRVTEFDELVLPLVENGFVVVRLGIAAIGRDHFLEEALLDLH